MKSKSKIMACQLLYWFYLFLCSGCQKEASATADSLATSEDLSSKQLRVETVRTVKSFDSKINSGNLAAYFYVINPTKISIVNDPVYGAKRKVVYMNVKNSDNAGITVNPRAQLETPKQYIEGQNIWVGLSVYFTDKIFTKWLDFAEVYGPPYTAAAPFRLILERSNISAVSYDGKKETRLWTEPMKKGIWYDFVYRELLSKDKGQVQVYVRRQGEKQFSLVVPNTVQPTITAANAIGPNYSKISCYWDKENTWTDSTKKTKVISSKMYLANHKVGGSFYEVAPPYISK
jgi:hypothetical protein